MLLYFLMIVWLLISVLLLIWALSNIKQVSFVKGKFYYSNQNNFELSKTYKFITWSYQKLFNKSNWHAKNIGSGIFDNNFVSWFSILTYNVGLLEVKFFWYDILKPAKRLKQRFQKLASWIRKVNADIVFLQEIYNSKEKILLIKQLQDLYPYAIFYEKKSFLNIPINNALLILSKFPIENSKFIKFKNNFWFEKVFVKRGFIAFNTKINNFEFFFINTHNVSRGLFYNQSSSLSKKYKTKQTYQVLNYFSWWADFIAWDFNVWPDYLKDIYEILIKSWYVEVASYLYPNKKFYTWNPSNNPLSISSLSKYEWNQKNDHIFVKKSLLNKLEIKDVKLVLKDKIVKVENKLIPLSDHFWLYSYFIFK